VDEIDLISREESEIKENEVKEEDAGE